MSTNNKDFVVNNGLTVSGTATLGSEMILNDTPISIDSETKRLKAYVNNTWVQMALVSDIPVTSYPNIDLHINYDGGAQ